MALTIEEQHETNDLDHDILATREVTFICGHKRVYEDISACQKSWMERCQRCPNCQYKRDKAYVEKLSAEINSPELLEMWLKETPPTKTSRKGPSAPPRDAAHEIACSNACNGSSCVFMVMAHAHPTIRRAYTSVTNAV